MQEQVWAQAYDRLLAESRENGHLEQREPEREQRAHPRFRMWSNIVWTSGEFQFSIVNLSISGIAFDANRPFEPQDTLTVRLSDLVHVRAVVLHSTPLEDTPMFIMGRHRVRCRFEDSLEGLRFLVMAKDLQAIHIDA